MLLLNLKIYLSILFQFAHHPGKLTSDTIVSWSVAGMRCQPSVVKVDKIIEEDTVVFPNISKLMNVGGSRITQITSTVRLL